MLENHTSLERSGAPSRSAVAGPTWVGDGLKSFPFNRRRFRMHRVIQRVMTCVMVAGLWAAPAAVAEAQLISSFSRGGSSGNVAPELVVGGMTENADIFVDRDGDPWLDVPSLIEGADYIKPANNDRDVSDYSLSVTFAEDVTAFLIFDRRVDVSALTWVSDLGFTDTGETITFGSPFGNVEDSPIYSANLPGGTFDFLAQDQGSLNMYTVAATPEPATAGLLAAALGLCLHRRRRD